ncbi:MAG: carbohydrate-binding family 9-like protein [Phycisphaeraceae bacterium]
MTRQHSLTAPRRSASRWAALIICGLAMVIGAHPADAETTVWQADFESGTAGARPYQDDAAGASIEPVRAPDAAQGSHVLRVKGAGQAAIEGACFTLRDLPGGRELRISARLRGTGQLVPSFNTSHGWVYGDSIALTSEWQRHTFAVRLDEGSQRVRLCFITTRKQGAPIAYELDDVHATVGPEYIAGASRLDPVRIEAESFTDMLAPLASTGDAVARSKYIRVSHLPVPRVAGPITVYARIGPTTGDEEYRIVTRDAGTKQVVVETSPDASNDWQWLSIGSVHPSLLGDRFQIDANSKDKKLAIDAIVLASRENLPDRVLAQAAPVFADGPLVTATRADQAPHIDGEPTDPAWSQTVGATDFLTFQTHNPVAGDTTARITFDNENLYVMFRCTEPILDAVTQRQHEFVVGETEHDGDVYRDASCAVLFQAEEDGPLYEIGANALGTVIDARCDASNIWHSRDLSWSSEARASATTRNGSWVLELAIPWQAMGMDGAPEVGSESRIALTRLARAREEYSAWNPTGSGVHNPEPLGRVRFAEEAPGVAIAPAASQVEPGENKLSVSFASALTSPGVYAWTNMNVGEDKRESQRAFSHLPSAEAGTETAHVFQLDDVARPARLTYGMLNAATLQPLYQAPTAARPVRAASVTLALSTPQPYELQVNGRTVRKGASADGERITLPVREGANDIQLRADAGYATLHLSSGSKPSENDVSRAWRVRPRNADEAAGTVRWETDNGEASADKPGARYGNDDGPAVLQHMLLWHETKLWPTPRTVHLARGTAQHTTFINEGIDGRALHNWTTYLALPDGVEATGATGFYGTTTESQPKYRLSEVGTRTFDGRSMRVFKVTADKPIRSGKHYIMSLFQVMLKPATDASFADGRGTFWYWSAANDGTVTEPARRAEIELLPALNGRQPEHFTVELWGGFFGAMDNEDVQRATLQAAKKAGINMFVDSRPGTNEMAAAFGIDTKQTVNFRNHSMNMQPYLEKNPDHRLIKVSGEPRNDRLCMTRLLDGAWPAVREALIKEMDTIKADVVEYDYEFSVFDGPQSCYCNRCLSAFHDHAGLSSSAAVSGESVQSEHRAAWIDFMTTRTTQMFKQMKRVVHEHRPGTKFGVYSGYPGERTRRRYGVDWGKIGKAEAIDVAGMGYGRPVDAIEQVHQLLPNAETVFGELLRPTHPRKNDAVYQVRLAVMLRRAIDARDGVLIFDRKAMDGRSWHAIAEATRLIAAEEEMFMHGQRSAVEGAPESQAVLLRHEGRALLCVMNDANKQRSFQLRVPGSVGTGKAFYTDRTVAGGRMSIELEPGEAEAFVFAEQ